MYGKEHFEKLSLSGGLSRFNKWSQQKTNDDSEKSSTQLNQYTFVDLAQIVCKVPVTCQDRHSDEISSEDEYIGYASEPTSLRQSLKPLRPLRTGGSLSLSENEYESDTESEAEMKKPNEI